MLFVFGTNDWWYYNLYNTFDIDVIKSDVEKYNITDLYVTSSTLYSCPVEFTRLMSVYNDHVLFTTNLDKPIKLEHGTDIRLSLKYIDIPNLCNNINTIGEFNKERSLLTLQRLEKEQQMELDKWRKEQLPLLLLELIADDVNKNITLCRINGELTVKYKHTTSDYEFALSLDKFSTSHYNGLRQTVLNDNKQHLIKSAFDKLTKDEVNALGLTDMYNTYVEEEYF